MSIPHTRPSRLGIALLAAALALAAGGVSGDDKKEQSKKHFDEGQLQYNLGRFDQALASFTQAYEILPLPGFLFNIGQCHRELGDCGKAVFFFEGYLRDSPQAKNRALVQELIGECKTKLQAAEEDKRRVEEEKRRKKELERREQERKRLEEARAAEAAREIAIPSDQGQPTPPPLGQALLVEAVPPERAEKPKPVYEQIWFWAIIGGAAAALLGGAIYTAALESREDPSRNGMEP